ncbi:hypothetical protein [Flaviaesturariibacter amylovorans]|uniref:Uncharacterized protein n=1 Tax=Flaviaesturariibacter amylovorans TaxID=1084520 RepID=A0ABP8GGE5_9BACT
MKLQTITLVLLAVLSVQASCRQNQKSVPGCYKGRLEVKGLCQNYTIKVVSGTIDPALVQAKWTDETTGKEYENVFALGNPCVFPERLNAGDEFWFLIDNSGKQDCIRCMAFYPTPEKKLNIRIQSEPCQ